MSAVNPFDPPRAAVHDLPASTTYATPRVWSAKGRLGRLRYLGYSSIGYLVTLALALVGGAIAGISGNPQLGAVIGGLVMIPYAVLVVMLGIQRTHDMGWSGWWLLAACIPFVALIWIFKAGTPGENRFGAPPPPNTLGVKIAAFASIGVMVVGMLAAVAIPAYQQYTLRAKAAQSLPAQP